MRREKEIKRGGGSVRKIGDRKRTIDKKLKRGIKRWNIGVSRRGESGPPFC